MRICWAWFGGNFLSFVRFIFSYLVCLELLPHSFLRGGNVQEGTDAFTWHLSAVSYSKRPTCIQAPQILYCMWISTFIRGFVSVIVDSAVVQIAIMLSSWSCSPVPNQFYFHPNPPFTSCISGNITACPIFLGTRMELITENPHSWPYEGQSGVRNVCAWQWSDAAAYFGLPQDLMGQFVSSSQASARDRCGRSCDYQCAQHLLQQIMKVS